MTIYEFMDFYPGRLIYKDKWLVLDDDEYTVYQKKYRCHKTNVIYRGNSEDEAIKMLED